MKTSRGATVFSIAGSIVLLVALAIAGCSDGGSNGPTAPPDPIVNADSNNSTGSSSGGGTDRVEFASIDIEKQTNGVDADFPPGVVVVPGSEVTWSYTLTNNGNEDLINIQATDNMEGDLNCPTELAAGETAACDSIVGEAGDVDYSNTAEVTAETASGQVVSDSDDSHYTPGESSIAIDVQKLTNGEDADSPTGPIVLAADDPGPETVTWTYFVTNLSDPGLEVIITSASDDRVGAIVCPGGPVPAGTTVECDSVSDDAVPGQYANLFTVEVTANGDTVTARDRSHYFGADPELALTKLTDGQETPVLIPGCPVTWTYEISNTGNVEVESIVLEDDMEGIISCPSTSLDAGDSMTCSQTGVVGDVPYENEATVSAEFRIEEPNLVEASDSDGYTIDGTPVCEQIVASVTELWPPNHRLVDVDLSDGVCDRVLDVQITGVTQDEPLNDSGDGNTEPDAFLVDDDTVQLRSERAGTGDGRVYLIGFDVFDPAGGLACSGEMQVDVPHDQGGAPAVDSRPPSYDSFTGDVIP